MSEMWSHKCEDGAGMAVAKGEPCNWCDATEPALFPVTAGDVFGEPADPRIKEAMDKLQQAQDALRRTV